MQLVLAQKDRIAQDEQRLNRHWESQCENLAQCVNDSLWCKNCHAVFNVEIRGPPFSRGDAVRCRKCNAGQ